ncbi:MAG: hypothetical protein J7L64_02585 [Acidobacteria bacterium]|nr:hypothetical protein [Acidobacteriota bacterium]
MASYSRKIRERARRLFESGITDDAEIARMVGVRRKETIRRWRIAEDWEGKKDPHKRDIEEYLAIIDEAIGVLKERILEGSIKGSFSDLEKLIRLRSFLVASVTEGRDALSRDIGEDISDEELDKELKATEARIAALEGEKGEEGTF